MITRRRGLPALAAALACAAVAVIGTAEPALASPSAATAAAANPAKTPAKTPAETPAEDTTKALPAPPRPKSKKPTSTVRPKTTASGTTAAPAASPRARTAVAGPATGSSGGGAPGADTARRTLVLYDTTSAWGWLGEAYAVQAANLVSHGSPYVMHPVANYAAGEMSGYTSVVYVGSTYDEPLPTAFLDDTLAGTRPVLWMYDNIWQLTARATNFAATYGWTWDQFDYATTPTVTYKGVALQRDPLAAASGLMATRVTDRAKASVVATATRADGTTLPWAVTGGNLTYLGEVPFSYVGPTDRYFAGADLLLAGARPAAPARQRALVRIEDVSPDSDPAQLRAVADVLAAAKAPFSVAVVPQYLDPKGTYNNGVSRSISLAQAPAVVSALKYMVSKGGTLLLHGYTHQYSNVANPYGGTSTDDFEFYRAHVDAADNVVYDGPVAEDSASWFQNRVAAAKQAFSAAGLTQPTIFEPPHYAASVADYQQINSLYGKRYDRGLFAAGVCPSGNCGAGTPDYTKIYGQFYPFLVRDIYGSAVVPESLGNIETEAFNNHPPRLPADLLASAKGLTVVRDGAASFFYHPYLGTAYLKTVVSGLQSMGYQFVTPATILQG